MVHPNEAKVLQLFGKYVGTTHERGLRWANPLYAKVFVSTRVRNFESNTLKVNDANGSPIEIRMRLQKRWLKGFRIGFVLRDSLRQSGRLRLDEAEADEDADPAD